MAVHVVLKNFSDKTGSVRMKGAIDISSIGPSFPISRQLSRKRRTPCSDISRDQRNKFFPPLPETQYLHKK